VNLLISEIIAKKPCAKGGMFHFKKMHLFIVPSNSFFFQQKKRKTFDRYFRTRELSGGEYVKLDFSTP